MIPVCFSQPNTSSGSSHQLPQSLITCIYQTEFSSTPSHLTLTWSRTLFSHSLTIHAPDSFSLTISLNASTFSFFKPRPGSKSIYLTHLHYQKIKLYWDFTKAKFPQNCAQPESSFYIAISCNSKLVFYLGDLPDDLSRRSGLALTRKSFINPALLSRREHVVGRRSFISRADFMGSIHEIEVECTGGVMKVKIDEEVRLTVRRLAWKFRGNERMFVGGIEVDFFWDVFNWVNNNGGHAVFVFQVGEGGVWPEVVGPEKRLMRKSLSSMVAGPNSGMTPPAMLSPSPSCSSILQWAEESSSDGGRSSSCSSRSNGSTGSGGFSLLLYAWRED